MYYPLRSYLIFFFLLFLFHHLPCASSKQELRWCESQFQCGNITAGFPFWGGDRPKPCGHRLLELRCNRKKITSLNISNHEFTVFHIDQISNTIRLARTDLLGPFCSADFITTTFPSHVFELSKTYKNLPVYYFCDSQYNDDFSSGTCPDKGILSLGYYCQSSFTVNVPMNFYPGSNLTDLEVVLREGFELEVVIDEGACQDCSSFGGICGFNNTKQVCCNGILASEDKCHPLYILHDAGELYRRCSVSFSCGNQNNLSYPFWVPGREGCGHPDFKLECSRGFAETNIESVKFRILEMNYDFRIIVLARSDYIDNICPRNPINAQFNQSVLPLAPDTEQLTLFYNCSLSMNSIFNPLVCENDSNDVRNYYVTNNISSPLRDESNGLLLDGFKEYCKRYVTIPVSRSALRTLAPDPLKRALEVGFQLQFNQDCSECMESKGSCGYNQTSRGFVCYCHDGTYGNKCGSGKTSHGFLAKATRIVLGSVLGGLLFMVFLLLLFLCFLRKREIRLRQQKLKALIPLQHYTYAQVKRITKSFAEVVGRGGFGTVYKGTLSDGRVVAVKLLKDSKNNGEDFINEVASISRTSHLNIVSLLGFCSEGSKRAIIYEFLGNGSLDKFISGKTSMNMDQTALCGIALGVARGLEYLHHSCKTRIVHFDIKPQNVLLDDNFCPKVSDFGLAKLCEKKESALSFMDTRGTIGYIAPEMISRVYGSVSHKSDVYSYGMLVLEMIGARNKERAHQDSASNASSIYFPEWIYRDLELVKSTRLNENGISNEEDEIAKKMTLVGLWCIQCSPSDRPSMDKVVEMMEGSVDALEVPPRPVFQIPSPPLQDSSPLSEDTSGYTEGIYSTEEAIYL